MNWRSWSRPSWSATSGHRRWYHSDAIRSRDLRVSRLTGPSLKAVARYRSERRPHGPHSHAGHRTETISDFEEPGGTLISSRLIRPSVTASRCLADRVDVPAVDVLGLRLEHVPRSADEPGEALASLADLLCVLLDVGELSLASLDLVAPSLLVQEGEQLALLVTSELGERRRHCRSAWLRCGLQVPRR
jgi:hypothetical protein